MGRPIKNLAGQKFGMLTVIERAGTNSSNHPTWLCKCDCGNEKIASGTDLKRGYVRSCGCLSHNKPFHNLSGERYGRLTVLYMEDDYIAKSGRKYVKYRCRCDCGNEISCYRSNLLNGTSNSCGCLQKELLVARSEKHGGWTNREKLYDVWCSMRKRCHSETNENYGSRGILICQEWDNDYLKFKEWSLANGYKENVGLSIDRIDVNGNYCPENCRWTNAKVQQNNRRSCINITYNGETHTLKEWSEILNVPYSLLHNRYRMGWNDTDILTRKRNIKHKNVQ